MTSSASQVETMTSTSTWQPQDGLLLEVDELFVEFRTRYGVAKAINGVNLTLRQGETARRAGRIRIGQVRHRAGDHGHPRHPTRLHHRRRGPLLRHRHPDHCPRSDGGRSAARRSRWSSRMRSSSLNPVFPVGWQIAEMFRKHRGMNRSDSLERAVRLMERVQIPAAKQRVKAFPHQFSGGMRQRIMIAMAIALDPAVLIADEPTTALDVTVQAQVMKLLKELQEERQMGLILITHDLGVVADVADRIAVMYAGRIVEQADIFPLYANPAHPYTKGLLESIPRLDQKGQTAGGHRWSAAQPDQDPAWLPVQPALQIRAGRLPARPAAAAAGGGAPPLGGLPLRRAGDGRRGGRDPRDRSADGGGRLLRAGADRPHRRRLRGDAAPGAGGLAGGGGDGGGGV